MKTILCFGDSNTYGLMPGAGGRYDRDVRWTGILEKSLHDDGYRVVEEGLCGRTTVFEDPLRDGRKGVDMLPMLLESHSPIDILVIMLGTNDCKAVYDVSAELIGKGMERLLDQIQSKAPEAKVILASPIALGEGVWEDSFDKEYNRSSVEKAKKLPEIYKNIATERGIFFIAASDYAEPCEADREHMDEAGHKSFAKGLAGLIKKI